MEGNKKVDQAAKRAAEGGKNIDLITLILYLREQVTRRKVRQKNPFLPALIKERKALTLRFL